MTTSNNTGEYLRQMLFKQLEALTDPSKTVDLKRAQVSNETAQVIINSAKVEVEYVKAIDGAITLPFVEGQEGCKERPYREPGQPQGGNAALPGAETQHALGYGSKPSDGHPWRKTQL